MRPQASGEDDDEPLDPVAVHREAHLTRPRAGVGRPGERLDDRSVRLDLRVEDRHRVRGRLRRVGIRDRVTALEGADGDARELEPGVVCEKVHDRREVAARDRGVEGLDVTPEEHGEIVTHRRHGIDTRPRRTVD